MEAATANRLTLWQITEAEEALAEKLMAVGGELTPELEREWESLQGSFDAKVERVALYVRELAVNADTAKVEAARLKDLSETYANRAKYLRAYLQHHMERTGRLKVETARARVTVQKNGGRPSIYWSGLPDTIPTEFRNVTITLNGEAAHLAHTENRLPDGFVVTPIGSSLRIS